MPNISYLLTPGWTDCLQCEICRRRLIADWEYDHYYAIPIGHIGMHTINGVG